MWEVEIVCEVAGPLVPGGRRALEEALASAGMEIRWGRRALRLRCRVQPRVCMAALGNLSRYLALSGLPVRLYQISPARPAGAA